MPCGCLQIFATGCRETEASLASAVAPVPCTLQPAPCTRATQLTPQLAAGTRRQLLVTHLQLNAPKSCEFFTNAQFVSVNTFVGVIEMGWIRGDNRAQGMH